MGNDWKGVRTLGDSKLKFSGRDLQVLTAVFLIDIPKYRDVIL